MLLPFEETPSVTAKDSVDLCHVSTTYVVSDNLMTSGQCAAGNCVVAIESCLS